MLAGQSGRCRTDGLPGFDNNQMNLLQGEAEKLLALLKDRQLGLMSWHMFMNERLTNMHGLISRMLGK